MIRIEKASAREAVLLTKLSGDIYKQHYLHLWHPGGADWYMNEYAYATDKIKQDLTDKGVEIFIAYEDAVPVGYLKLVLSSVLAGYENHTALEVERIYIDKAYMGRSIGKQFMQIALNKARELKKEFIFLKAMDSATDAIAFYEKLGYTISGKLQLPMPQFLLMKEKYRGMVILHRTV
jgi:ribosomal protein S18 acetylase RimI-like enzyme